MGYSVFPLFAPGLCYFYLAKTMQIIHFDDKYLNTT